MTPALIPFNELQGMADAIASSGLFGMKTSNQALALMLVAQAEGQHPATITQEYDIIQGKATRKTHSVMARFQASGGTVEWHELTDLSADATFKHKAGGALRMKWTFEQAKKAGLVGKDNWKNYPRAMLRARCIAEGVRAVYPAALGGMLVAEEAMDMPVEGVTKTIDTVTGEIHAAAPAGRAELPAYPGDTFSKKLPTWRKNVDEGGNVADLIAMLSSKYTLSAEQLRAINALAVTDVEDPASAAEQEAREAFTAQL